MSQAQRPRCPTCGKLIPKLTCTVWIERPDASEDTRKWAANRAGPWSRTVFTERPEDIEGCRKLTNRTVVSVSYGADGRVQRFGEWDGESYWTASRPFCKPDCAVSFARAAYIAGYRLVEKETA